MIQHVTREISPDQLDASASFYALLGFESVPVPPGIAGRAAWLEHAGTQIHLMFVDERVTAERRPSGHVGIVVADYERTLERLAAAGYRVQPRREHWGSPRSYVRDPVGYLVELIASPPAGPGE
jgi:catechol 2,3-dioxygenase-like lactoylglutathione lyase family enzyme